MYIRVNYEKKKFFEPAKKGRGIYWGIFCKFYFSGGNISGVDTGCVLSDEN